MNPFLTAAVALVLAASCAYAADAQREALMETIVGMCDQGNPNREEQCLRVIHALGACGFKAAESEDHTCNSAAACCGST